MESTKPKADSLGERANKIDMPLARLIKRRWNV